MICLCGISVCLVGGRIARNLSDVHSSWSCGQVLDTLRKRQDPQIVQNLQGMHCLSLDAERGLCQRYMTS